MKGILLGFVLGLSIQIGMRASFDKTTKELMDKINELVENQRDLIFSLNENLLEANRKIIILRKTLGMKER